MAEVIAQPLAILLENSWWPREFPDNWKKGKYIANISEREGGGAKE